MTDRKHASFKAQDFFDGHDLFQNAGYNAKAEELFCGTKDNTNVEVSITLFDSVRR